MADTTNTLEITNDNDGEVCALEAFPAVQKRVSKLWGTRDLDKLIKEFLLDSRDGTRQGFPLEVAQEFLFLAILNKYVRALDVSENMNIGIEEAYQMVDSGDEAHLGINPWNDPLVSKDSSVHEHHHQSTPRKPPLNTPPAPQIKLDNEKTGKGLEPLIWFIVLIIVVVIIKLLFPQLLVY